jgi:choline-sulfatase
MTSFLDDNIGKVLKALDDCGLSDDTRVVYTSDHGDNLGTRGLWGKSNMYEPAANIPMIMAGPDVPQGKVCNTPVTHVDCYQTILDCVGVPLDDTDRSLPGTSMYEIAAKSDDKTRVGFSEYHASSAVTGAFMLRRDNYKYIYYVEMEPELFDIDNDPMELNDLSKAPQHQALMREFEALLRDIVDPEEVDRRAKADQAALVEKHGGREAVLKRGSFGGTPAPGYKPEFKAGDD